MPGFSRFYSLTVGRVTVGLYNLRKPRAGGGTDKLITKSTRTLNLDQ
jgi:hypothetical protein